MRKLELEHRTGKLPPHRVFWTRVFWYSLFGSLFLAVSLGIGTLGYRFTAGLSWVDAFLNASMILTGMGPVDRLPTDTAKIFAGCYAIFSGVSFLTFCGVLFTPFYHRFMHKFHLDLGEKKL
ncbi:MAG: hypothetical protein Q7U56_09600 [Humidesulfovibrio sp.]|nr:hypothetical protein [Humidesulfovibrio sp.]